jgi:transposase InsO family protein
MWHSRLDHTGTDKLRSMLRTGQFPSVQNTVHCNECVLGKQHRHPFHGSIATATRPGDVIHSDVVGTLPPSHSGSCYLVKFVDEFTRYVTIFALIRKSAVLDSFKVFHREFERLHTTIIKDIHSDNGGWEYAQVATYALQFGISVHRSAPYTPQSNGIAERQNRSIFEMVRTTFSASGLPPTDWVESGKNAVYIRNRLPVAGGVSPFEKLFGRAPLMSKLRPFGCLTYLLLDESKRKNLDIKFKKCILLANLYYGNYRLLELSTRKLHVSRHVTSTEDQFPARAVSGQSEHVKNISNSLSERELGTSSEQIPDQAHDSDSDYISDLVTSSDSESSASDDDCNSHGIPDLEEDHDGGVDEITDSEISDALPESEIGADVNREHEVQSSSEHPPVPPRRSSRVRISENEWRAFQVQTIKCHALQERDVRIPIAGQTCHIRDISESDYPSLKTALNSPSRDLWEIAIAE